MITATPPRTITTGYHSNWQITIFANRDGYLYSARRDGVEWARGWIRAADEERVLRMAKTLAMDAYGVALQAGEVGE